MSLLDDPITWGHVLAFGAGWATVRGVRWWRRNIAWQHSSDEGAASRRLRAEERP